MKSLNPSTNSQNPEQSQLDNLQQNKSGPQLRKPTQLNKLKPIGKPIQPVENETKTEENIPTTNSFPKNNVLKNFSVKKEPDFIQEEKNKQVQPQKNQNSVYFKKGEVIIEEDNKKINKEESVHKKENIVETLNANGLTPTEFYCLHYDLIKETIDNVLTKKYPGKVVEAIDDLDIRMGIENESSNDVRNYIDSKQLQNLNYKNMSDYIKLVFAEAMGFGILEFLLNDKEVDEIIVQTHDNIQAEIHGILEDTEYKFPSFNAALGIVKRIIRPLNKTLDVSNPNIDGQLPNGSRISASIPPLRAEGQISMNIRKFSEKVEPLLFYAEKYHSSTPEMVEFINACVGGKKTIIVSGGTGSGKTTILNSLTYALGKSERILVIEDTREIHCQVPHAEYYLTVPPNAEGYKGISISDIMQIAQRKRPDRIYVGECRGGEMNEFLNAANTGHDGSTTSLHSNNPTQAFSRMENMLQKNDDTKNMTHEAIQRLLTASVDIIVQTQRLIDGSRRITHVTEIIGYGDEGFAKMKQMKLVKDEEKCDPTKIYMKDVFYFKEMDTQEIKNEDGEIKLKVRGQFLATGYVPYCIRELRRKGFKFDKEFFNKRVLLEV